MSTAAPALGLTAAPAESTALRPAAADSVWRAPLVPLALAATAGIVLDRYAAVPLEWSGVAALVGVAAWLLTRRQRGLALLYLWTAVAAAGAAYHHAWMNLYAPGDIGHLVTDEGRPVRVRGVIVEEPTVHWQQANDPLRSMPRSDPTLATLRLSELHGRDDWEAVSGRVRLVVAAKLGEVHVGDEVEVVGRLRPPRGAANPGEFDYEEHLRDQRIRAVLVVQKTGDGVTRLAEGWRGSVAGWLAVVRAWGQERLQATLPPDTSGVAAALLLGDGSTMTSADWDKYIRTGVIHVLAISGQHLVVLAFFLWLVLRVFGVRQRRGAWFVALFLLGYALLTGGRPPVLRSAVTVCAACGGLILGRPVLAANTFALAWLVVAALNPTDNFSAGCQLSFLAVAILYWGAALWTRPRDPLERLIDEARPAWQRALLWFGRAALASYLITLVIWLAAAPLVAARYHLVSPVGVLLGPPCATSPINS